MKAMVVYEKGTERVVRVGKHQIHEGGPANGFCYTDRQYDCQLTDEEKKALDEVGKYDA